MLFMVEMTVTIPHSMRPEEFETLKAKEKAYAQDLQRSGKWRDLWRIAGRYANVSIFDVADPTELNEIVMGLPLFAFMEIKVTALCKHPSAIA